MIDSQLQKNIWRGALLASLSFLTASCAQAQPPLSGSPPAAKGWKVETVAQGAPRPWGMAWLPDGQMLVTSKEGTLHRVNGKIFDEIELDGMPPVYSGGQGGLFDIALHPNFAENKWVYMTLSSGNGRANRTILVRGTYEGNKVSDIQTLFRVNLDKSGGAHFGSRLLWVARRHVTDEHRRWRQPADAHRRPFGARTGAELGLASRLDFAFGRKTASPRPTILWPRARARCPNCGASAIATCRVW